MIIIITEKIESFPIVGDSAGPSITAAIKTTSIVTIESVRISVPKGSPNLCASSSASLTTPNEAVKIVDKRTANTMEADNNEKSDLKI
ncbi:hypothetical protein D3C86_1449680 [compost metagenome]